MIFDFLRPNCSPKIREAQPYVNGFPENFTRGSFPSAQALTRPSTERKQLFVPKFNGDSARELWLAQEDLERVRPFGNEPWRPSAAHPAHISPQIL
jgi:hypothetical protein